MKTLKTSYESNLQQPYTFQGIQSYQHLWFSVCKKGGLSLLRWIITMNIYIQSKWLRCYGYFSTFGMESST